MLIRLSADFSAETLQTTRESHNIWTVFRVKGKKKKKHLQSRIFYSARLSEEEIKDFFSLVQFGLSVMSDSLQPPWTAASQASLPITNSWSFFRLMPIESVTPSNHLILCCPLLLPPSLFPSIRVFSNESVLHISWPKY